MTSKELLKFIDAGFTKSDMINLGFDFPASVQKPVQKPQQKPVQKPQQKPEPKPKQTPEQKPEPGDGKTWDDVYNALTGLISTIQAGNIVSQGVVEEPKKDEFWGLDKIINPMNGQEV